MLHLSYINLSPGLKNKFSDVTFKPMYQRLSKNFLLWTSFLEKYPEYDLGFIITTKKGVEELHIKGPSISKRHKMVDYTIWLPDIDYSLGQYIDFVFEGIFIALKNYNVEENEIIQIKEEVRIELNLI